MTAATYPPVICGAREQRTGGTWECVRPPSHDGEAHYYVRLVTTVGAR